MSRNGSGVYSLPAGYEAVTGETATATQHNTPLEDLETDMNTARPVVAGGTGATTAAAARTNLGLSGAAVEDYEEGTWTPVLKGESTAGSATYSIQTGYYTRTGDVVTAQFRLTLSAKTSVSGNIYIEGLPYDAHASIIGSVSISLVSKIVITDQLTGIVSNDTDRIHLYDVISNSNTSRITDSDIQGTMQLIGTAIYKTDEAFA